MKKRCLPLLLGTSLLTVPGLAQSAFNNAIQAAANTDNTGNPVYQPGTEILNSTPGLGVVMENGATYEHVGQFYVAANGLWNRALQPGQFIPGMDYFGYAPDGIGANLPYLGTGIKGASDNNGGKGTGRPTFGHLRLNSTGVFPVEGGMFIAHSLTFNADGPGLPNRITTPNANDAYSPMNAVEFAPSASIAGMDNQNYIDGYASVTGVIRSFTLPLGDLAAHPTSFRPLTISTATAGTITARYLHSLQHPTDATGTGIGSVSPVGTWLISAPAGTVISVEVPALELNPSAMATLRLVGWNGNHWADLSGESPSHQSTALIGTISATITAVAIGSTSRMVFARGEEGVTSLQVWPNPTSGRLNVALSAGKTVSQLRALNLQGRSVLSPTKETSSLDATALPAGTYLLEVLTNQGQTLRTHFVKQP